MKHHLTHPVLAALLGVVFATELSAQTSAFTYQGRLAENGQPASGSYDLLFSLHDTAVGGNWIGSLVTNEAVAVNNGLFTVLLDFGANAFTNDGRWLEIAVRTNSSGGSYTVLSPRQALTPVPTAMYALTPAGPEGPEGPQGPPGEMGPEGPAGASPFRLAGTNAIYVDGNVGVGTTNPATALHVAGTVRAEGFDGPIDAGQLSGVIPSNNIGVGSITSLMLAEGAVTTAALAKGAVTVDKMTTVSDAFTLTIANPTPANDDRFGTSVAAVRSDRVLIGAEGHDTDVINSGVAYLYRTDGTLLMTYTNPTPEDNDWFGNAVAGVGADQVLIGAYRDDTGAADAGAAYLFGVDGSLLMTYTNPAPESGDIFGFAIAGVGADQVLIGAYQDDTVADDAGAAYLFNTSGTLMATFTDPTPEVRDNFGFAVAGVGTDKVLIGAQRDNTGAFDAGAAYLYSTDGTLLVTYTNPAPADSEYFGSAVSAVGPDRVLIGASGDDTGAPDAGVAYLFSTSGTLLTTYTNPAPASGDQFGSAVSGVGLDKVLIGADLDDTGATNSGVAYLLSTNGTLLMTYTNPAPAIGGQFGKVVAAAGANQVLIAARLDVPGATDVGGLVYLYTYETYIPGLIAEGVRSGAITTTSLADGAVDTDQLAAGAVTAVNIATLTITSNLIAQGAVTADKIAVHAVTAGKIAGNAVTSAEIADGTITEADIAPYAHLPGTLRWQMVSQPSVQALPNRGYLANASGQVLVTLPASPSSGDRVRVVGMGLGGWRIAQNAGQSVITAGVGGPGGIWTRCWSGEAEALACSADGTKLLAATGSSLRSSADSGLTWTLRNPGGSATWSSVASSGDGTTLAAVGRNNGPLVISTDSGATWTTYETNRDWRAIACTADGSKFAAVVYGGYIFTSTNFGITWMQRGTTNSWMAVASSSNGSRQVAANFGGDIYVSYDIGVTWVQRYNSPSHIWQEVAASSDGARMYAVGANRAFYYSEDSGLHWMFRAAMGEQDSKPWNSVACSGNGLRVFVVGNWSRIYDFDATNRSWIAAESERYWNAVVCSADGSKVYAAGEEGIFSSAPLTTLGTAGFLLGDQAAAVELLYLTNGQWRILSHEGVLNAY